MDGESQHLPEDEFASARKCRNTAAVNDRAIATNELTAGADMSEISNPLNDESDELDTVAHYMSELLGRYGIDPSGVHSSSQHSNTVLPESQPSDTGQTDPGPEDSERDTEPIEPPVEQQKPVRRPTAAPEKSVDLSSMRALANSAARGAIANHSQQMTVRQAYFTLLGACAAIAISFLALHMTDVRSGLPLAIMVISTTLAGFCSWRYCRITRELANDDRN